MHHLVQSLQQDLLANRSAEESLLQHKSVYGEKILMHSILLENNCSLLLFTVNINLCYFCMFLAYKLWFFSNENITEDSLNIFDEPRESGRRYIVELTLLSL